MFLVALKLAAAIRRSDLRSEGINLFYADGEAAFQEVFHSYLHCSRVTKVMVSSSMPIGVFALHATNSTQLRKLEDVADVAADAQAWASGRVEPMLLVVPEPQFGFDAHHVQQLMRFSESILKMTTDEYERLVGMEM